ncbi:MAG: glycosyltransferase family 4 protein [Oscillospiraceae bacterium]|nr:glycosyltransferase family 4 protein [Oscillospiraceae bacterium]
MKKLLFISNISNAFTNFIIPSIKTAQKLNYEFHMAANYSGFNDDPKKYPVTMHHLDLKRTPFHPANIKAYKQLLGVMKSEGFDYIHCNTPVGGLIGRLAGKKCKVKKIIYQVHGFHFYKGAPLFNHTVLKWAEKLMARFTDAIITINSEDFEAAKKFRLKEGGKVYFVHGVGITLSDFEGLSQKREEKRAELKLNDTDVALISAGDLNKNKNNAAIIRAIASLNNPKIKYFLCGIGPEKEALEALSKQLGISDQVIFLGYRSDIKQLYAAADVFVMPSFREGLSRSMMEAMASGLPCVASEIRGNVDLIENGKNGYLCPAADDSAFSKAIENLANSPELRLKISKENLEKIKQYDVSVVEKEIRAIYEEVLKA